MAKEMRLKMHNFFSMSSPYVRDSNKEKISYPSADFFFVPHLSP